MSVKDITNVQVGSRVQHRAWYWRGTVTEIPDGGANHLSTVTVKIDSGKIEHIWMPALITDTDDFVYDWSDEDGTIEGGPTRKSKKRRHKR